ncbi:MAG: ShlB/FhaC/HecB family hemolysin secretion/activation protein [Telluria sp.]
MYTRPLPPPCKLHPLALGILLLPGLGCAQAVPDAGRLLESNRAPALIAPPGPAPQVLPDARPAQHAGPGGSQRVPVRAFILKGVSAFPEAQLQALLQPYAGRALDFAELSAAAAAVSDHYRAHGYFLASATLPAQDLGAGQVTIQVLEGRVSGVTLRPDATVRLGDAQARRYLDALVQPGQPVRESALERALLLTQDLPGMRVRAEFRPGAELGDTALALDLAEAPLVNANIGFDNSSNRYTGRRRLTAGLQLNDPAGLGDQLSLLGASTGSDFKYARVGYVLPLGAAGTRIGAAYSALRYRLGEEFEALDANGRAQVAQLLLTHPLLRTRRASFQLRASFEDKRYDNRANGVNTSDKRVRVLPFGLVYTGQDRSHGGYTSASLDFTPGHLDLSGNPAFEAADALAGHSAGRFLRTNYSLSRYQRLAGPVSLMASVSGQFASTNLESGEKLSLGGPGRVRAYAAGEASGDEGHVATLEARLELPALESDLGAFVDYGHVTLERNPDAGAPASGSPGKGYALKGAGLTLSWRPFAGALAQVTVARKIGANPGAGAGGRDVDGSTARTRAWFQVGVYF